MNYELAKKLKDAGFPQNKGGGRNYFISEACYKGDYYTRNAPSRAYVPTLSELIEACGVKFAERLQGNRKFLMDFSENNEESVANLWLELNKK